VSTANALRNKFNRAEDPPSNYSPVVPAMLKPSAWPGPGAGLPQKQKPSATAKCLALRSPEVPDRAPPSFGKLYIYIFTQRYEKNDKTKFSHVTGLSSEQNARLTKNYLWREVYQ
jgi:hypothetical protein